MLKSNMVRDERISQAKRKITNEAFGLMFIALTGIVFVKSVVLELDIDTFITEYVLWISVAVYVFVRMLMMGIYAQNIRNAPRKNRLLFIVVSDVVFTVALGTLFYSQGTLNVWALVGFAAAYFAALFGLLKMADLISERRINKED